MLLYYKITNNLCYIFSILLLVVGCKTDPKEVEQRQPKSPMVYFDIENFLNKEKVLFLKTNNHKILKTNILNKNKDQKEFTTTAFDWQKELALFYESNINKPSLLGKYVVDSLFTDGKKLAQLRYVSHEKKTRPQQLDVHYRNDQIVSIEIKNNTKNSIYTSFAVLQYMTNKGYTIRNIQQLAFGEVDSIQTEVVFLK